MAEERVTIIVQERGTRIVERRLRTIGTAARGSQQGVNFLRSAIAALGSALLVRRLGQTADAFTNIQNRIRLVTSDTAELNAVTNDLLEISNRTRSSFAVNAELFNRVSLAVRELGLTQRDVLDVTKSLNQAVILSGASAQEASAGLIQLSQGLASGALRGDELRSVLEQLPAVADVIATELNVTRGELRKLGEDGRLTSEVIISAFANARSELNDRFATTVPTIGQSFTVLGNRVIAFIGSVDKSLGITQRFNRVLTFLGDNIDTVARLIGSAGLTAAVLLAASAVTTLTLAIVSNPFLAIAGAAALATSAVVLFSDKILVTNDGVATLRDLAQASGEALNIVWQVVRARLTPALEGLFDAIGLGADRANFSLEGLLLLGARAGDIVIGLFRAVPGAITTAIGNIDTIAITGFTGIVNGIIDLIEFIPESTVVILTATGSAIQTFVDQQLKAIGSVVSAIDLISSGNFAAAGAALAGAAAGAFSAPAIAGTDFAAEAASGFLDALQNDVFPRLKNPVEDEARTLGLTIAGGIASSLSESTALTDTVTALFGRAEFIAQQRDRSAPAEAPDLSSLPAGGGRGGPDRSAADVLLNQRRQETLSSLATILEQVRGANIDLGIAQEFLNTQLEDGNITLAQSELAFQRLQNVSLASSRDLGSGIIRGINVLKDEFGDFAATAENAVVGAFRGMQDVIVDFVQTGKLSFTGLINSIVADLTRLLTQRAFQSLLAAIPTGPGSAGFLGSFLGAFGGNREFGGPVESGRAYVVGENGPEIFEPRVSGQIIPNPASVPASSPGMAGQQRGGGESPRMGLTIINTFDDDDIGNYLESEAGAERLINVISRKKNRFKVALQ